MSYYSAGYPAHDDEGVAIAHKTRYDAYPSPASHAVPLYPRTYPAGEPAHRIPTINAPASGGPAPPALIASPSLLNTRGLEISSNGGNYYGYDSSRNRAGMTVGTLLASPTLLSSPRERQLSGRESPSLAGAFGIVKPDSPTSPLPRPSSGLLPTLRVISWTPQSGEEGTLVNVLLDPLAIHAALSTPNSIANFGPGSPTSTPSSSQSCPITRHFRILFGNASSPTTYSRSKEGAAKKGEDTALVALSTVVPPRGEMGAVGERVLVVVQVVDEKSRILEDVIVGEWDSSSAPMSPVHLGGLKRRGEDLVSEHGSPARRSPLPLSTQVAPMSAPASMGSWGLSPRVPPPQLLSPLHANSRSTPSPDLEVRSAPAIPSNAIRHPPIESTPQTQPDLIRTSQIPSTPGSPPNAEKAILKLDGDLGMMAVGWTNEEWTARRRLVQFWRVQDGSIINASFQPLPQADFVVSSIVISCIFRDDKNECYVTSVDTIYLLEALVGARFSVEEKNRIRRNLEGFKPTTVSKSKVDSEPFFSTIMGYVAPRPRTIEKDVKVFPWKVLSSALKKIIGKYSANYSSIPDSPSRRTAPFPSTSQSGSPSALYRELEDPSELQEQQQLALDRQSTRSPLRQQAPHIDVTHHSRPGSFDFNAMLRTSSFADFGQFYDGHILSQPNHLFPSAEDYGVASDRSLPPLNHVRYFSDGPREPMRRSTSGHGASYHPYSTPYATAPQPYGDFQQSVSDAGSNYYAAPPQDSHEPSWGFGYDQQNGQRRMSASWRAQYGYQGMPMGMGMGLTMGRDMVGYPNGNVEYHTVN